MHDTTVRVYGLQQEIYSHPPGRRWHHFCSDVPQRCLPAFFFEWLIAERQVWILGTATEGCTESWLSCGGSWGNPFGVQLYPSLPNRGEHSGRGWKWVHFSLGRGLQLGDSQPFTRDCGSGTEPPLHATTLPVPVKVKDIGKSKYDMLLATVHVQESGPGRTGVIFLRATSTLGRGGPPFK